MEKQPIRTYSRKRAFEGKVLEGAEELCRLCLSKPNKAVPIFTQVSDFGVSLATRITVCVGLEMSQEDCLPNQICSECHLELECCYRFRKKCEASYQRLKSHLKAVRDATCTDRTKNMSLILDSVKKECTDAKGDSTFVKLEYGNPMGIDDRELDSEEADSQNKTCFVNIEIDDNKESLLKLQQSWINKENKSTSRNESVNANRSFNKLRNVKQVEIQSNYGASCENEANVAEAFQTVSDDTQPHLESSALASPPISSPSMSISSLLTTVLLTVGAVHRHQSGLLMMDGAVDELELTLGDGTQVLMALEEEEPPCSQDPAKTVTTLPNGDAPNAIPVNEKLGITYPRKLSSSTVSNGDVRCCGVCARTFATSSVRARHEREVHARCKPHACDTCGRAFSQRCGLLRHQLLHEDRRPFQCPCGRAFRQRSALQSHAATHAGTPPIRNCPYDQCHKRFRHSSGLSRHIKWHEGRQFVCADCGRVFGDKSALRRHLVSEKHRRQVEKADT